MKRIPTSTHWGDYLVELDDRIPLAIHPAPRDRHPSPIGQSLLNSQDRGCRIPQPSVRRGYLDNQWRSDGSKRGIEPFVQVPWDEALDLAAEAMRHTIDNHGNESMYGGSYGWSSAGRFHHAQGQLHRFLNHAGGYTASVQTYSTGTAHIILPHVIGINHLEVMSQAPTIDDVLEHTQLIVSFGGISMKNMQINQGGIADHTANAQLQSLADADIDVVCVSPVKGDTPDFLNADWWPIRPNADVALMLALAHTLSSENLIDHSFLATHCVGFDLFRDYLHGHSDGIAKDAEWAQNICDVDAHRIRTLARRMGSESCLLSISWSLQRTEHGDQPYWMITVLAAMLGNIGLPGQGVGYGYGCIHNFGFAGRHTPGFKVGSLPQGKNPVSSYIPVARIADMLLNPGAQYPFDGQIRTYPDIKLVYWAGGNPYHHHQDLNKLREAWSRPETILVNDSVWTATARHADIVFPATTSLEREDFAWGRDECSASAMHQVLEPYEGSRDDFDIFSGIAQRLGFHDQFTEGRTTQQWIRQLWHQTIQAARDVDIEIPDFESFWAQGGFTIPSSELARQEFKLEKFREDPTGYPLGTPSGKIEIFSKTLSDLDLDDCKGHPSWLEKEEFLGSPRSVHYPLALNSNQPITRLHSQYDFGKISRSSKIHEREPVMLHPVDAATRGIDEHTVVRIYNDRGATLATAVLTQDIKPGVVVLPTGAWYDPQDPAEHQSLDVHGNPNVLTRDVGSSTLAQGTSAHSCLVEVERYDLPLPDIKVFSQPPTEER